MKSQRVRKAAPRRKSSGRKAMRSTRPLSLINFKISDADRKMFQRKANKTQNGNVSALILRAVRITPLYKLRAAT